MNENDYQQQPVYQEEPVKPQVDMLPCNNNPTSWFNATIVCCVVDVILSKILVHYAKSHPFSDTGELVSFIPFLSILLSIPAIVFFSIFAKGCKKLIHNEYTYAIIFVCLNIAFDVIAFIGNVSDMNHAISWTLLGLLAIGSLVMLVLLTHSFVRNYSGELRELGVDMRDVLKFTFIILGIIILGVIVFLLTESYGVWMAFIVVAGILGLYTAYLTYLALRQANSILEAGEEAHFTDYDLDCYLNGYTPVAADSYAQAPANGYAPASAYGNPAPQQQPQQIAPQAYADQDRKLPDWWYRFSIPVRVLIILGILAALAGNAFLIYKIYQKVSGSSSQEQTEYYEDYDEDDEDIYGSEDEDIYGSEDEDIDASDAIADAGTGADIPSWVPDYISRKLIADDFTTVAIDDDKGISGTYKGTINEYPITFKIDYHSDGTVTGKYAYDSTLRRYGDVSSSWFKFDGVAFNAYGQSRQRIVLRSYAPDTGKLFEYWDLIGNGPDDNMIDGSMFNAKYLDNPSSKLYQIHLEPEE